MSDYTIKVDLKPVQDALKGFEKQIPFALSLALNNVAKDAQKNIQDGLASRFTLRRPDFLRRTIKITTFAKKAAPAAVLQVDPERDVLAKHEEGGEKVALEIYDRNV